jgi:hypothetical protein
MVDISRWLAEHGLGHHAATFRENGIAGDVLRDLTEADLRELGLNIGDRKRLLKAVAALDAEPASTPTAAFSRSAHPPRRHADRRRSAASSPSCSSTWQARPSSATDSIRRTSASSCVPTTPLLRA